jgi:hypothetical protein
MKRKYQPIVVVYKRKWGNQKRMKVFTDLRSVDSILEDVKGKFIPATAEILELGVGSYFIDKYKKKHEL